MHRDFEFISLQMAGRIQNFLGLSFQLVSENEGPYYDSH